MTLQNNLVIVNRHNRNILDVVREVCAKLNTTSSGSLQKISSAVTAVPLRNGKILNVREW